jgi:glucose/arabinose dehydrogenase
MRQLLVCLTVVFLLLSAAVAQTPEGQSQPQPAPQPETDPNGANAQPQTSYQQQPSEPAQNAQAQSTPRQSAVRQMTLPAGTTILLQLQSPIYTKTAHVGDGVYCESTFPVTQDNQLVIPAGTYVKGRITHIERPKAP